MFPPQRRNHSPPLAWPPDWAPLRNFCKQGDTHEKSLLYFSLHNGKVSRKIYISDVVFGTPKIALLFNILLKIKIEHDKKSKHICKYMESAYMKKQAIVIFSIHIFHTLRPHTLPSKRVKMR